MTTFEWVKLPTYWIQEHRLSEFRWGNGEGSGNISALAVLIVIAHHADQKNGLSKVTYNTFEASTYFSRSKISEGIKILIEKGIISKVNLQRSTYIINGFNPDEGWGKLPCKGLYSNGKIPLFCEFKMRSSSELDALKIFLLIVERRDESINAASISYDTINMYTKIDRIKIRKALSLLAVSGVVHANYAPSYNNENYYCGSYRLAHVSSRRHSGTTGKI